MSRIPGMRRLAHKKTGLNFFRPACRST